MIAAKKLEYTRDLPVRKSMDVFVAGGGPAGVAAAVTAARAGASVFLAESLGAFGGMGTSAGIPFINETLSTDVSAQVKAKLGLQ